MDSFGLSGHCLQRHSPRIAQEAGARDSSKVWTVCKTVGTICKPMTLQDHEYRSEEFQSVEHMPAQRRPPIGIRPELQLLSRSLWNCRAWPKLFATSIP